MEFDEHKLYHRKPLENERFLRSSSVTIGDRSHETDPPVAEYSAQFVKLPQDRKMTQAERIEMGNTLRKTSFELGDQGTDFRSTNQMVYTKPKEGEKYTATFNTQELQRSHLCLGDLDSETYAGVVREGFKTSNTVDYAKKPIPRDVSHTQEQITMLRREHWSVGDFTTPVDERHFQSTAHVSYLTHTDAGPSHLEESTRADLRRSHISFGGAPALTAEPVGGPGGVVSRTFGPTTHLSATTAPLKPTAAADSPFSTTQRSSYVKPDATTIRGVPNAGVATGILPTTVDATTKTILRKHHYELGDGDREFSTTYGETYQKKPLDPDVWGEVKD